MYKVYIADKEVALSEIRVSAHPFNRVWPGKQRDISQTEIAYMLKLYGEAPVKVEVVAEKAPQKAVVRPLSKGIKPEICGNSVSFEIPQNGKYSVEIDGKHHAIHLFYCKKKEYSPTATYSFESGHHYPGLIRLQSGDSVYIGDNAVVHGSLLAIDAEDIKIYGGGVLCGDWEVRTEKHGDIGFDGENYFSPELVHTCGGIRTYRCSNITLEGITVTDTASYGISFFASDNIKIDDVNVVGLWKYNCDGIDFFNCRNIRVDNCFIRSFDDSMCMKGLTAFSDINTENAHITNTVFWCDWGKNMDIGLATACKEIKNIAWENCDIIHNAGTCITISNGQWADVHDVAFRDVRIEYSGDTEKAMIQENDEDTYLSDGKPFVPALISISDQRRNWQGNISYDDPRTKIRDIDIYNINVYMDKEITEIPNVLINKTTESSHFENIRVDNVFINSQKLEFDIKY